MLPTFAMFSNLSEDNQNEIQLNNPLSLLTGDLLSEGQLSRICSFLGMSDNNLGVHILCTYYSLGSFMSSHFQFDLVKAQALLDKGLILYARDSL